MIACIAAIAGGAWWVSQRSGWLSNGSSEPGGPSWAAAPVEPAEPEAEPTPEPEPAAPIPGDAVTVGLRGVGSALHVRLDDEAPGDLELVIQKVAETSPRPGLEPDWMELARELLEPGEATVVSIAALRGSQFDMASEMVLVLQADEDTLGWADQATTQIPEGLVASIKEGRLNLADREAGLLVVLKPIPEPGLELGSFDLDEDGAEGDPSAESSSEPTSEEATPEGEERESPGAEGIYRGQP